MRLGRVSPPPRLTPVVSAVALIAAGCVVLVAVAGAAAVGVGACLVTLGVGKLVSQPPRNPPARSTPPVPEGLGRERITVERHAERRTRERVWPLAG